MSTRSAERLADIDLVKKVAVALARLRHRDISGVRLVGLPDVDPERRTLVLQLIEDHSPPILGRDVILLDLPDGEGFELLSAPSQGDVVDVDIHGVEPSRDPGS